MKIPGVITFGISATAAALLAACSSGSSVAPTVGMSNGNQAAGLASLNGWPITAAQSNLSSRPSSFVALDGKRHHQKRVFQYISDFFDSGVLQFDYPKSTSSIGRFRLGTPHGECTKNGKKTFWVVDSSAATIDEFKVGSTTPIATLIDSHGEPNNCAVDPNSGDLAAMIRDGGDVVIWRGAQGTGYTLPTGLFPTEFGGYDNSGHLFVDGIRGSQTALVEIPSQQIALPNTLGSPGSVQWDGKYLTIDDRLNRVIYQYTVSGTTATEVGSVALTGSPECWQTWIANGLVFCPDPINHDVEVYNYPAGGSPIATLTGAFSDPFGAVQVSE